MLTIIFKLLHLCRETYCNHLVICTDSWWCEEERVFACQATELYLKRRQGFPRRNGPAVAYCFCQSLYSDRTIVMNTCRLCCRKIISRTILNPFQGLRYVVKSQRADKAVRLTGFTGLGTWGILAQHTTSRFFWNKDGSIYISMVIQ